MLGIDPLYLVPILVPLGGAALVVLLWRRAPWPQRGASIAGLVSFPLALWTFVVGNLEVAALALLAAGASFGLLAVARALDTRGE